MIGREVAFEHLHAPTALKACDGVRFNRSAHADCGRALDFDWSLGFAKPGERSVDRLDKSRQLARLEPVIADMSRDDVCGQRQDILLIHKYHPLHAKLLASGRAEQLPF
jgi:hypothetical protein